MTRRAPGRLVCVLGSALAGGSLVAAFAPFNLWPLAALAPIPLLWVVSRQEISRHTAALSGVAFGASFFIGAVYWLVPVMGLYGGLSVPAAIGVTVLLVAYLAAFTAGFAAGVHRIARRHGPLAALATAPALWAALELLRNHALTGFPWVRLGTSLHVFLPLLQLASVTGVYGLSALLLGLASACAALLEIHPAGGIGRPRRGAWVFLAVVLALTAAVLGWGARRAGLPLGGGQQLRVACIQGNVSQDRKWQPEEARRVLDRHLELSARAAAEGADLIAWSESSLPYPLRGESGGEVLDAARELGIPFLVGSLDWRRDPAGGEPVYNSAFLVGPEGMVMGVYDKVHLVPFGEYVPWKKLLAFVAPLVEEVGDLRPGEESVILGPIRGIPPLGLAICYEIIFPELSRRAARRGAELLLNLTNDAWFGTTPAPHQHFAEAVLRAVETDRFLVRAANTGISGIVDPRGRVLVRSVLNEETIVHGVVRSRSTLTPYAAVGDVFAWACAILAAAALLLPASRGSTVETPRAAPPSRNP